MNLLRVPWIFMAAVTACSTGNENTVLGDAGRVNDLGSVDVAAMQMGTDASMADSARAMPDAGPADTGITLAQFCMGAGPPVEVGDTTTSTMTCAASGPQMQHCASGALRPSTVT